MCSVSVHFSIHSVLCKLQGFSNVSNKPDKENLMCTFYSGSIF